ncbi:MAG: thiamine diphosphokinase [Anaerolineaceae bacterium]|nr:thiamine diphosphokinase [Anaerolineaceae bacterium]
MTKTAAIFLNGEYAEPEPWIDLARNCDLLIGVDGGSRHILSADLIPQTVIGDLDSLRPDHLHELESLGIPIIRHSPQKNETDFELALIHAINMGCDQICVFGALGGRLDHMLANLLLPVSFIKKAFIRLIHDRQQVIYIYNQTTIHGKKGDLLSLIPIKGSVTGVRTEGLLYPLENEALQHGRSRGISNELTKDEASVSLQSGVLVCIHTSQGSLLGNERLNDEQA